MLGYVDTLSYKTTHMIKPWQRKKWCIPPKANAGFVCTMENVPDVKHPYDSDYPLVCMDESSKQHILEVRPPLASEPSKRLRYDTEYKRNGVSNLFVFFEPLAEWRSPIYEQPLTGRIR